jgi:hypothetical protein
VRVALYLLFAQQNNSPGQEVDLLLNPLKMMDFSDEDSPRAPYLVLLCLRSFTNVTKPHLRFAPGPLSSLLRLIFAVAHKHRFTAAHFRLSAAPSKVLWRVPHKLSDDSSARVADPRVRCGDKDAQGNVVG